MKKTIALFLALGSVLMVHAQKSKSLTSSFKQQLIGTWILISVDNIYPDSSRVHPYGDAPKGMLMFDKEGNYTMQILKDVRPKIASGDKNKCTPQENEALVQGSNSHFGKYLVDEANKTVTFIIEHAFFTNWEGTQRKLIYTYKNGTFKYQGIPTQGGPSVIAEVAWKRL
jgi:hypothetical protein